MLTIQHFQANYDLPAGLSNRAATQTRMDRLVRERLPTAMTDKLAPPSSDENAVYRIRNLRVDLWIDALGMSDGEIAQRWSAALLVATTRALVRGSPTQVARYDDHAHFVAAFLGDLMAGQAWSRWVYDEFAPLRGLPVGQIVTHLLAPRPALLIAVTQRLSTEHQLEPLLHRLELADLDLIWEQGLGLHALPDGPIHDSILARILDAQLDNVALEQGGTIAVKRNALRLYLKAVTARPALSGNVALGAVCRHLALVYQLWAARPSPWLWTALAREEIISPAPIAPLLSSLDQDLAAARDWLTGALSQPAGRAYLARLIPVVVPVVDAENVPDTRGELTGTPGPSSIETSHGLKSPTQSRQLATGFAGLALLLPVIRDLGLHEHLTREGLYQVLLSAVGRDHRPLAWSDAGPAWLVGMTAQEAELARDANADWPDIAIWDEGNTIVRAAQEAQAHLGPLPCAVFALLALRRFAQGLRGFAESSPAYLAEQFINLPGHLWMDVERIEVHLSRAPLGIVLRMAGRDGDRGPIPWLEQRHLWITLP